ncbi:MAG TPA: dihydrolipoamide acetyltransferase family protein [Roseiflexaceae bacterium]|nr:dihydrolipoamide acetyltransferase family protein [Roseiflexaceae bacterium]
MAEITMPRLSDTMSEGSISRWLKKPGDQVEKGDIVAEIETDKATMELEAFDSGTLQQILVPEGKVVPIGEVIAIVGSGPVVQAGGDSPAPQSQPVASQSAAPTEEGGAEAQARTSEAKDQPQAVPQTGGQAAPQTNGAPTDGKRASPLARRVAAENGVDLGQITGTGPGGRIIKENVEDFIQTRQSAPAQPAAQPAQPAAQPAAPAPVPAAKAAAGEVEPLSRMRRAIARAMTESKPGVPHIYITSEIDMGEVVKLRKQINDSGASDVKISVNDMVIKAAAKALLKFPQINSSYAFGADGQPGVVRHPQINVSVAVAIEDGLLAPVVRDADKKSLGTIAAEVRELAKRAREGKSKQQDLDGATFQVSNLGMFDVVEFVSIITVPQAASLAVGAVREVPVVRDGQIVVGEIMHVTLSVDHRVADGASAAQYLQELKRLLQAPMSLLV